MKREEAKSSSLFSGRCTATILLRIRQAQHRPAGRRQLRHGHRRFWLWRHFWRFWMEDRILEPEGQVAGAAAFAVTGVGLAFAFARARRAFDADVEMIVVTVHRPHLV